MSIFLQKWLRRFVGAPPEGVHQKSVRCMSPLGLHRMRYLEWGEADNPRVLICVHGLTRNAHDFDFLARRLAADYRVVCPDIAGRGGSDWLKDPNLYGIPQYASDIIALIARLDVESVHWVGTSMGGLIGMALAAQNDSPIERLVLNDVGPVITAQSLQRICEYVGTAPDFPNYEAAEAYVRAVSATFGNLTDAQWRHLTEYSIHTIESGGYKMNYDPGIGIVLRAMAGQQDVEAWSIYDAIRCPTLVIRGADSDLLTAQTAREMGRRGPQARVTEIAGVGHAPALMDESQIDIVREFLLET